MPGSFAEVAMLGSRRSSSNSDLLSLDARCVYNGHVEQHLLSSVGIANGLGVHRIRHNRAIHMQILTSSGLPKVVGRRLLGST
jgi:hypothetical protein